MNGFLEAVDVYAVGNDGLESLALTMTPGETLALDAWAGTPYRARLPGRRCPLPPHHRPPLPPTAPHCLPHCPSLPDTHVYPPLFPPSLPSSEALIIPLPCCPLPCPPLALPPNSTACASPCRCSNKLVLQTLAPGLSNSWLYSIYDRPCTSSTAQWRR